VVLLLTEGLQRRTQYLLTLCLEHGDMILKPKSLSDSKKISNMAIFKSYVINFILEIIVDG